MRRVLHPVRVLAVDPGPTPGLAAYDTETQEFRAWICPRWSDGVGQVYGGKGSIPQWSVIVCESFSIGGSRRKSSNETIEMIGALRWCCLDNSIPFVEQSPADAAGFVTNRKLKAMGWYTPGAADHARSATAHLLLYLTRARLIDVRQLL